MDFERLRQDGLWEKVIALCEQQKQHHGIPNEPLHFFYLCEAQLERVIEAIKTERKTVDLPEEIQKALVDRKNTFGQLLRMPLPVDVQRLTRILIAKICFMLGDLNDCLIGLDKCDLGNLNLVQETNRRNLKIFAEAFCLKGSCLTKLSLANAKLKPSERTEMLISDFEISNDISLRCSNLTDAMGKDSSGSTELAPFQLSSLLQDGLLKCPNLYAKNARFSLALERFRDTLRAVESSATRKTRLKLTRQLMDFLLRCYLGGHYIDPRTTERQKSVGETPTLHVPRPNKYQIAGAFIPVSLLEEAVLLLHISEALVIRDLSTRASADDFSRRLLLSNSVAISDICIITYNRLSQLQLGIPFIERAAKSCSTSPHIWRHYAMYCILKGDYRKALHVLEQCVRVMPKDRSILLFAAKLCIDNLFELDRGIKFAEQLCRISEKTRFIGRARLTLGVAYSLQAFRVRDLDRQKILRQKAMKQFLSVEAEESCDFLVFYHIALEFSFERKIDEAFRYVKKCLRMNMDFLPAHHLLALLLSCSKRYEDALNVLEKVEVEFEEEIEVELTKIRLQAKVRGAEDALKSCRHVLTTWKRKYEREFQGSEGGLQTVSPDGLQLPISPLAFNTASSPLPPMFPNNGQMFPNNGTLIITNTKASPSSPGIALSGAERNNDAMSFRADSVATLPRTEGTLSEMASTTGSFLIKNSPQKAFFLQLNIWTLMAELYLSLDQPDSALECLVEAASVGPPSHLIYHLQGMIFLENRRNLEEAKRFFEDSLAINPWFSPSHIQMGRMQRKDQCFPEAERHFREALLGDSTSHEAWAALGELYMEKGNDELAMEYLEKARILETTNSIQSFTLLPRGISY